MKRSKEDRKLDLIELVLALVALAAIVGAAMATFSGCIIQGDEEEWRELVETRLAAFSNKLATASATLESPVAQGESLGGEGPIDGTDATSSSANDQHVAHSADEADFAQLQWAWGGFNGKNATPVPGCVIAALDVGKDKMTYKWKEGGCELLGAADRGDASCLACFFVQGADGSWRGGKFDWISTSRTSRSFENIHGEYNGWPADAVKTARGYAFCIVSKDGRKRTNVIVSPK